MSKPIKWKIVTRERYWEMLEILPPATQTPLGFLVGEPWRHRTCGVTGRDHQSAFAAFTKIDGKYYEALDPMTVAEFRRLLGSAVLANIDAPVAGEAPSGMDISKAEGCAS